MFSSGDHFKIERPFEGTSAGANVAGASQELLKRAQSGACEVQMDGSWDFGGLLSCLFVPLCLFLGLWSVVDP